MQPPEPTPTAAQQRRLTTPVRGRMLGIDVARALAVIGMVMIHVGPIREEGLAGELYALPHGRASVLFVLLAGVGVTLLARDRSGPRLRSTWERLAWRAVVLLPLGLGLQELDHGILVILQYYALYFLVAGLGAMLGDRPLLAVTGAVALLAPLAYLGIWHLRPDWFGLGATGLGEPPLIVARQLLLSGSYPVLVWSAPLLLGVWVGRRDLRAPSVQWRLLVSGLGVALVAAGTSWLLVALLGEPVGEPSWGQLVSDDPHSEMPLWVLGSTGSAVAVLGASLIASRRLPRSTWPVAAAGQLAFTIYVGHLLVLHWWPDLLRYDEVPAAAASVARFAVVVVVGAALWRLVLPRGPLEMALRPPWRWGDVQGGGARPVPRLE